MSARPAGQLDALVVLAFAAVGRASHAEGVDVVGIVITAAPFGFGAAVAGAVLSLRDPMRLQELSAGAWVVVAAVVTGLTVRALVGDPPPASFAVVTIVVLALGMLGWRLAVRLTRRPG